MAAEFNVGDRVKVVQKGTITVAEQYSQTTHFRTYES